MNDTNNDGILRENDLRNVLKPVMVENGMDLLPISHFVPPSSFNNAAPFHWFSPSLKKVRHLAHILLPSGCKEGRIKLNFLWILCESCSERRISQKSSFAYLWSQMGRYWSRCGKTFSARWRLRTLNSLMDFFSAVTDDKFHQVISAKGNASKLVTILSNNSGQAGQGQRCQNSVPLSGWKTLDWDFDSTSAFGCVWHKQWRSSEKRRPVQSFEVFDD